MFSAVSFTSDIRFNQPRKKNSNKSGSTTGSKNQHFYSGSHVSSRTTPLKQVSC